MENLVEVSHDQLAADFKEHFADILPDEVTDKTIAQISSQKAASVAATSSYPANGSIASLILYVKCQCVIKGGKTFDGSIWGVAFPGGGALFGDVYTDDLNKLYAKTTNFKLVATPVYTSFYFYNDGGDLLGHFQAGAVSIVTGVGFSGGGRWS